MPTALIAEDEDLLAAHLRQELKALWPALDIVAMATHGEEAMTLALRHQPEVCFLDIRMPGMTGLEAAAQLADEWPDGMYVSDWRVGALTAALTAIACLIVSLAPALQTTRVSWRGAAATISALAGFAASSGAMAAAAAPEPARRVSLSMKSRRSSVRCVYSS